MALGCIARLFRMAPHNSKSNTAKENSMASCAVMRKTGKSSSNAPMPTTSKKDDANAGMPTDSPPKNRSISTINSRENLRNSTKRETSSSRRDFEMAISSNPIRQNSDCRHFLDELAIFYPPTYHGGREYIDDQSFVARLKRHRIVLRSVPTPRTDTVSSLTNIETSLGAYSRFRVASLNAERSFERRIFR